MSLFEINCLIAAFLTLEGLVLYFLKRPQNKTEIFTSIGVHLVNQYLFVIIVVPMFVVTYFFFYKNRLIDAPTGAFGIIYCFFFVEFAHYVHHWLMHKVPWLWLHHSIHHSPTEMNFSTAIRQFHAFSFSWLVWCPLGLVGIPFKTTALILLIIMLGQILIHTEVVGSLGWLDTILQTPSNHRVHHWRVPGKSAKNLGSVITLFDRLFGTYEPEGERVRVYGIPDDGISQKNHLEYTFGEIIRAFSRLVKRQS